MKQLLQSLYKTLNQDIKFSLGSVDETDGVDPGSSTLIGPGGAKPPQEKASSRGTQTPAPELLRFLTLKSYQEQTIKRKSEQPFQLRYAAYGESSNVMCAHTYAWHDDALRPHQGSPNGLSLAIEFDRTPIAFATLVFDSMSAGMSARAKFPDQIGNLRAQYGNNLCEITSFAINKNKSSRRVLAGLMHLMYLYARQARQMQVMLVQTRMHHIGVYEDLLGFTRLSVQGDVALLSMSTDAMRLKIRQFGGNPETEIEGAGLYRFFFKAADEAGLQYRLLEHLAASGTSEG